MPIKNYTTSVAEEKTVGEIMGLLAGKGARQVHISYDDRGRPESVSFVILLKRDSADAYGVPVPFKLPCNFEGVFRALLAGYKDRSARNRFERDPKNKEQARRIAWRIIKDWVEAQVALIEADQASMAQVFLPYVVSQQGPGNVEVTLFERFIEQTLQTKALTEGESGGTV